jgi:hypothetical protein
MAPVESPRRASQALSGYLCGTHSGLLGRGRKHPGCEAVTAAHRALDTQTSALDSELGGRKWMSDESSVSERLSEVLDHPEVLELVLFGSQARGGVTGFSDVDAILVISDEAAENARLLRSIRPRVLAAQRAVLAYQPMQHHGFEVATPKLLRTAHHALALPPAALAETCSLYGRVVRASLSNGSASGRDPMETLVHHLVSVRSWPGHVWNVHRTIAMFELLPTLYLQNRGRSVPKWQSFDEARKEFQGSWWPYDVLNEIRLSWPRRKRRTLEAGAAVLRNPWAAIAGWRRLPGRPPEQVRPLLTEPALEGLRTLARAMAEQSEGVP